MGSCIFCKIGKGEISSDKILETDNFLVFKDISPRSLGHSLVIPKKHFENFLDFDKKLYQEFLEITKKATQKILKETKSQGFNLVINNRDVAGQVVDHLHLHIIPRKKNDKVKIC